MVAFEILDNLRLVDFAVFNTIPEKFNLNYFAGMFI